MDDASAIDALRAEIAELRKEVEELKKRPYIVLGTRPKRLPPLGHIVPADSADADRFPDGPQFDRVVVIKDGKRIEGTIRSTGKTTWPPEPDDTGRFTTGADLDEDE